MRIAPFLLLLAVFAPLAGAQTTAPAPGDELSVYIMTMGPGDEIFEKFGHNTIRIVDRSTGEDTVYNWGVFDFGASHFYINFALGKLNYSMESMPYKETVEWYTYLDRSIWLQELNLTPEQKLKLRDKCRWWDRDANRFYPYNYYAENCSTKVRDVLDEVVDGQIKAQLSEMTRTTYRWHTRRLTRANVLWYLALDTVMGPMIDRPISKWEECFLPVKFSLHLNTVAVKNAAGNAIPLAQAPQEIYRSTRAPEPDQPPTWWPMFALVGMAIGVGFIGLARLAERRKWGKVAFIVFAVIYTFLLGCCGWFGLWGWACTAHWAAWRNENLLEISPLALPLAFLLPVMFRNRPVVRKLVRNLTLAIAISTVIALLAALVLPQVIADPLALVLPINLALAMSIWHLINQPSTIPKPQ